MVFGHGHPLTSGHPDSVDYFVSSHLFEPPPPPPPSSFTGDPVPSEAQPGEGPKNANSSSFMASSMGPAGDATPGGGPGAQGWGFSSDLRSSSFGAYSEQLVLMDSLTTWLEPPADLKAHLKARDQATDTAHLGGGEGGG
eukprot:CAMPEP_0172645372 /NCGR_PEP_ID=MMETSP1068-20121228/239698_1 /TAXON_ID=35684 /ORGANISM="Pseudopedinella elastica, Strain CCMP716" /LENGTH=139 /DNA_ID=CAMNT_0013459607 /DNA_START=565 /DNA_END=980 /DNA_ORIENTATION=-